MHSNASAGIRLSGGTDKAPVNSDYTDFLAAAETESFDVIALPVAEGDQLKATFAAKEAASSTLGLMRMIMSFPFDPPYTAVALTPSAISADARTPSVRRYINTVFAFFFAK